MKKLIFFNQFHNGDCFVGKQYVASMVSQLLMTPRGVNMDFAYAHNNHPNIIQDLEMNYKMEHLSLNNIPPIDRMTRVAESQDKESVFLNTWVGCWQGTMFPFGEHINFQRLHNIWREYFKYFDLEFIEDPNYYLPQIDDTIFDMKPADDWLAKHGAKSAIMICNGNANSGQSRVGDLAQCISKLSAENPEVNFLVTHRVNITGPNIYYTDDIFEHVENDLNQIAYLAGACDIIVGKNSGPFSYCQNAKNLMNETLTFLNLSLLATDCPSGGGLYKARCVHTAETHDLRIAEIITKLFKTPQYRGTEIIL